MSDLPSSAMGVLRLLNVSKSGVERFSVQLINSVKNGEVNALELKAFLKAMEHIIEIVDKATRHEQLKEADKYPEKSFERYGVLIEKAEVGTKYDYLTCGDTVYERLHSIVASATDQLKDREKFLKSLSGELHIADEGTGEMITVRPPVKRSQDGLKFSIR